MRIRMNEQIYNTIKLMRKGGATIEQIAEYKPISYETMRRIDRTEDYAGYVDLQAKYSANRMKKQEQPEEPEQMSITTEWMPIPAHDPVDTVISAIMREQTEILRALDEKIGFLLKELTGKEA